MPVCKSCGVDKPRKEFRQYRNAGRNRNSSGIYKTCKPCHNDKYRDYKRRWDLENKYGITLEEYDEMAKDGCDLCGKTSEENKGYLVVDHDHETGKVRGVLCTMCNTGLGKLGDSVEGLTRALEYLNASN
jgi:hypothetical protein